MWQSSQERACGLKFEERSIQQLRSIQASRPQAGVALAAVSGSTAQPTRQHAAAAPAAQPTNPVLDQCYNLEVV